MSKAFASIARSCLALLALGGCASGGGAHPALTVAAPGPSAVTAGDSKTLANVPYGFQLVVQKGEEYYCKHELITGSRTNTRDVCLTKAQMEAQINGTQDYLKRARDTPVDTAQRDGSGGRNNGVMSQ